MGSGCQCAQICSLTIFHVYHSYFVSLSFYTIPICLFFKFAGFLIYLYKHIETSDERTPPNSVEQTPTRAQRTRAHASERGQLATPPQPHLASWRHALSIRRSG